MGTQRPQSSPVLQIKGEFIVARSLLERVLAIREGTLGPSHPDVAEARQELDSLPPGPA